MLYWDFWTNYWKNLAELAADAGSGTEELPPAETSETDSFSPKEKYEYLTEYGTQILCMLTPEKGCGYLSRNFDSITGNSSDACFGEAFYDIVHDDFRARLQELLQGQLTQNKPLSFRCKLKHGDGKYYWYLFLIHGKHQANSDEIVCVMENVHDSVQIQSTLQKAKLEAELALRARSEFLANMSHDLRTPLNAVIGFAQIMENGIFGKLETPQYLDYVKHIQESGHDLLTKIEDLLEISNIDAGRVVLERDEVYLSDILKHVIEAQLHHASAAGVILKHQPARQDLLLNVDRLKLQHILGHLISNAIRHSEQDGKVSIEVGLTDANDLELRVRDEGAGMTRSKLNSLTSALQEDNCWTAKSNHGIGLGLALTKEFVSLHGGTVGITSKPSAGTTVHITLPAECVVTHAAPSSVYLRQA